MRVSRDDRVIYANRAMAGYLRVRKATLVGTPVEAVAKRATGELAACFLPGQKAVPGGLPAADASGRIFEVKSYTEGGVRDILLDEITPGQAAELSASIAGSGPPASEPGACLVAVLHARLHSSLDGLLPNEARFLANAFCDEAAEALTACGGEAAPLFGPVVSAVFGAPVRYADNALRAVRGASEVLRRCADLRARFHESGRPMPPVSCGIGWGVAHVGTFGTGNAWGFAAMGPPRERAETLCRLARPGETLVPEALLKDVLERLPPGWESLEAESQDGPDLSDLRWQGDEIVPLAEDLRKKVWLVGPGVTENIDRTEFYFEYLWALKDGHATVPILRVVRPSEVGDPLAEDFRPASAPPPEQRLGKYTIAGEIGSGGMGKVYRARDLHGNTVAIKVLHSAETATPAELRRFRREAEVMARLAHRNICRVHEMSEFEGMHFLVMEYVDGLPLSDVLSGLRLLPGEPPDTIAEAIKAVREPAPGRDPASRKGSSNRRVLRGLPERAVLDMAVRVCDAVQFAHDHGVLHRDLKPGNILLRQDGEPLVADFGLAKDSFGDGGHSITVSGHVLGTLSNMAPEQAISSKLVDARADVYSLGTVLYEALSGTRHFRTTGNLVADVQALQTHVPRPLRTLNPSVSKDLEVAVHKCLRADPGERYRSVSALRADLERIRRGDPIKARPLTPFLLARRMIVRHRAVAAVATLATALIVGLAALAFHHLESQNHALKLAQKETRARAAEADLAREKAEQAAREARYERDRAVNAESRARAATEDARNQRDLAEAKNKELEQAYKDLKSSSGKTGELVGEIQKWKAALAAADKKIADLESATPAPTPAAEPTPPPQRPAADAIGKARRAGKVDAISEMAARESEIKLSRQEINQFRNKPDEVWKRISDVLAYISAGLALDPADTRLWMMKARHHIMGLEMEDARKALRLAAQAAAERERLGLPPQEDPATRQILSDICDEILDRPHGNAVQATLSRLTRSEDARDRHVSDVLSWLSGQMSGVPLLDGRRVTENRRTPTRSDQEIFHNFLVANGAFAGASALERVEGRGSYSVTLGGIDEWRDFRPLAAILQHHPVASIKVEDARMIDWPTWPELGAPVLDLSGSPIAEPGPRLPKPATAVGEINLSGTNFSNLDPFVRDFPNLKKLDISRTQITDLAPLQACRNLEEIRAEGTAISGGVRALPRSLKRLAWDPLLSPPAVIEEFRSSPQWLVFEIPPGIELSQKEFFRQRDQEARRKAEEAPGKAGTR